MSCTKMLQISEIFAAIFAEENFELFIYVSYGAQIHKERKSTLVSGTYTVWLKFFRYIGSYKPLNGVWYKL